MDGGKDVIGMNTLRHSTGPLPAAGVTAVLVCLFAGGLAACSAPAAPTDRAGGDTVVLHLATSDGEGVDPATYQGPMEFVDALEEVSDGRLKVDLAWQYALGAADAESQLVEAIASGEVDGGWPATRAFARTGVEGLEAVEAPMLLTSEAAIEELVSGDVAKDVLAQLDGTGMTGVGLMAAPLRRPVSGEEPIVGPEDWGGVTFRVYNSPVQAAAVRALGGRPVNMVHDWSEALRVGDLDGAEVDVVTTQLPAQVHNITSNVVLWPKVFVTTFNEELFDSLTGQQQDWIRAAAARAAAASVDAAYDASVDLQALLRPRHPGARGHRGTARRTAVGGGPGAARPEERPGDGSSHALCRPARGEASRHGRPLPDGGLCGS